MLLESHEEATMHGELLWILQAREQVLSNLRCQSLPEPEPRHQLPGWMGWMTGIPRTHEMG